MIKQLDPSVTGGSEGKKEAHCNCFHVPRIKNTVRGTCYSYTCMIKCHQTLAFKREIINYLHANNIGCSKLCVTAIKPVRKSHVAFKWDKKTTQQTVAVPRANVGKDMHFNTDESASCERPRCGATINKTTVKYGALMCIVNGQI